MKKSFINSLFASVAAMLVVTSCADDRYLIDDPNIGEGEATVSAEVTFKNFTPALDQSRAGTPGNALNGIENLYVFVYDTNGNLVYHPIYNAGDEGFEITTNTNVPTDGEGVDTDNEGKVSTDKASFSFPLPYGKYHIYAAANIRGKYATDLSNPEGVIKTEEGLKAYKIEWNSTTIGDNDQMFGYFMALDGNNTTASTSKGFGPVDVIVNKPNIKLSAWLRRLASKVTVAYDASGLNNGVWIYIKNVTVHDIAAECALGEKNDPQAAGEVLNRKTNGQNEPATSNKHEDFTPIETTRITYQGNPTKNIYDKSQTGIELYNGLQTPDGKPIYRGSGDHAANDPNSLFFFENMKGEHPDKDKRQQGTGEDQVGNNVRYDTEHDYQDGVPYGTYIEVEAYYISINPENPSEGNIKYRFMLGKDISFNYDVERNYHYKLTLGFKGWANQPDWHIDFDNTKPLLEVPPVYRVSYLYQQRSTLPVKVSDNCTGLRVEIIENNWAPSDPNTYEFPNNPASEVTNTSLKAYYDFFWNKDAFDNYYSSFETVTINGESKRINTKMPWLGFLALNMPVANDVAELDVTIPLKGETDGVKNYYAYKDGVAGQNALKDFYDEKRGMGSQGYSAYGPADLTKGGQDVHKSDCPLNAYSVVDVDDGSTSTDKIVMVNMWTRARTMIENAGFSGNNPYEYFVRRATLKVTATFDAEDPADRERTSYVMVLQEPRIVNPKAVWRKSGSNKPFHVLLMTTDGSNQKSDYTPLKSDGAWTAEVEIGSNVTLRKSETTIGEEIDGKIYGKTGTEVDFMINFNGDGCAVINVKYHNNNCYHKILVRQGYDEVTELGGNEWSNFTLQSATARPGETNAYNAVQTSSPFYLGSLYRMGRLTQGILESNNANTGNGIYGLGPLEQPTNRQYNLTNGTTASWVGLGNGGSNTNPSPMGTFYVNGVPYKVPELADFNELKLNCEFALGIVYGEATETATKFETATGYWIGDSEDANKERGVRGVIVYDAKNGTGRQILFSLGKDGFGRRKYAADNSYKRGMLIYSDVDFLLTGSAPNPPTASSPGNVFRPIPYNLKISPGAIYWLNNRVANGYLGNQTPSPTMSWDINYFNYDFNSFDNGDNTNWRDANLIKLIKVK